jgi:large subunit ribosomal protein L19
MVLLREIEKQLMKKNTPKYEVGDTVDVHVKITEGDKERIQIFTGIVIAKRGGGLSETFTVRRLVQGEGVERVFPVHSPRVADVVVRKQGKVRRAKLFYLRERIGRATKVREKITEKETPSEQTKPEQAKTEQAKTGQA